jgi:hypothetical protein
LLNSEELRPQIIGSLNYSKDERLQRRLDDIAGLP